MSFQPHAPLTELTAQIRAKQLSPTEVLRAYLARIERFNGELNAIVTLDAERAWAEARDVEQRLARGEDVGSLAGVPFAAKDLEDVGGMRTTYGSPLFADHVPAADSLHVARLRAAGAIVVGKTNTPEFGAYMQSSNAVFGATRNPWNLERTPGGSSGGAAAALVAGLVPLATASDGGGSIRHPAAFTGCVGLKPTFRRVPVRPNPILTFDDTGVWGPLTLTVRDAARLADVTFGPDEEDPTALPAPGESYEAVVDQPPRRLRIAWCADLGHFVQPDVAREVEAAAHAVQALGHAVEVFNEPMPFVGKAWSLTSVVNEYLKHGDALATPELLDPLMREGFLRVRARAADDLAYAYARRTELVRWTARAFARFDILMMPTLPLEAFPIGVVHRPRSLAIRSASTTRFRSPTPSISAATRRCRCPPASPTPACRPPSSSSRRASTSNCCCASAASSSRRAPGRWPRRAILKVERPALHHRGDAETRRAAASFRVSAVKGV